MAQSSCPEPTYICMLNGEVIGWMQASRCRKKARSDQTFVGNYYKDALIKKFQTPKKSFLLNQEI